MLQDGTFHSYRKCLESSYMNPQTALAAPPKPVSATSPRAVPVASADARRGLRLRVLLQGNGLLQPLLSQPGYVTGRRDAWIAIWTPALNSRQRVVRCVGLAPSVNQCASKVRTLRKIATDELK